MGKRRANREGALFFSNTEGVWIGEIVLPDGKKRRKRSKLQKVVRDWLDEQKKALKEGTWVSKETVRYGEFLDRYMTDLAVHSLRPKTIESYNYLIKNHLKPEFGEMLLLQIRPEHLQNFYSKKLEAGFSRRTVQYMHSLLHKTLDTALKWGLVARNVADSVTPPRPDKKPLQLLTVAQVKHLFEVLTNDRLYAFYVVAASTGLRRGELLGLQKSDVSLAESTLTVRHNLVEVSGKGFILGEPKSEASKRKLALPIIAVEALEQHLAKHNGKSDYVFCTSTGTPFSPRNIMRHFKTMLKKADLPLEMRIHDLRHAFISWLLASGTPPKDVQMIAGHSSFSVTMDIYGHLMPGAQKEAAKKIDVLFK